MIATKDTVPDEVRKQAEYLARDNREAEPKITRILWFPHPTEVRLVEMMEETPSAFGDVVQPFYFRESPQDALPRPTAVALIRESELSRLRPPADWGDWSNAVEM